jgi:hypothetical protein
LGHLSWARKKGDKELERHTEKEQNPWGWVKTKLHIEVHNPILFCTPVHSSAQGMIAGTDNKHLRASQHFPSPGGTGSAVSAWFCSSFVLLYLTMLVREPVHGMQGLLERHHAAWLQKIDC